MTFRGRLLPRLLAVLITVAGLVAVGAPPATAGHSRTLQYVALGDSYAAGQGNCLQTAGGYPPLLDARKHVHLRVNASCSGAETSDVIDKQVSALHSWTTLVTLTVGANDLHVATVAAECTKVPGSTACLAAIANASQLLSKLAGSLPNVYTAIAAAAPRAEILVTGYPYLFKTPTQCSPAIIVCQINEATAALNQTIESTVTAANDAGVNIQYVDVTQAFDGHGIDNPDDPFINPTGPDAFHPNAAGFEAYAAALSAYLP